MELIYHTNLLSFNKFVLCGTHNVGEAHNKLITLYHNSNLRKGGNFPHAYPPSSARYTCTRVNMASIINYMIGFIIKVLCFIFIFSFLLWWGSSEAYAATYNIDILSSGAFSPDSRTINTGDTVTWTNTGTTGDGNSIAGDNHTQHLVYPDPQCDPGDDSNAVGCWDGKPHPMDGGEVYSFTFMIGGTWDFHNHTNKPGPNDGILTVTDLNAPATTTDLAASSPQDTSINLTWISPGDDVGATGNFGTPTTYDVRYSTAVITDANWSSATPVTTGEPTPQAAGATETMTVTGLSDGTTYYFALKTTDDNTNTSSLSNVRNLATTGAASPSGGGGGSADSIFPGIINDLSATAIDEKTVELIWSAPGDDGLVGTASFYDTRYNTEEITIYTWTASTQVANEPLPKPVGTIQSMRISNLLPETTYYFALNSTDDRGNEAKFSNAAIAETLPAPDITGPYAITDLTAATPILTSIELAWTAPGDDGDMGKAARYDIRYATTSISKENWVSAIPFVNIPPPMEAGLSENLTIPGFIHEKTYYIAIKTSDEAGNESGISNPISFTIPPLLEKSAATITPQDGKHITATIDEGVIFRIEVPPAAVSQDATFRISPVDKTSKVAAYAVSKVPPAKNIFGRHVFDVTAEIPGVSLVALLKNITLTFTYGELQFGDFKGKITEVHYYDEIGEIWIPLETTINSEINNLTSLVDRVALFSVLTEEDTIPPPAPTLARTKALGEGRIQITWTNPTEDFSHAKIYRSEILGELGEIRVLRVLGSGFTDTGVVDGNTYFYTVRSVDAAGNESENANQAGAYAIGTSSALANLIRAEGQPEVYVITGGKRRHIPNAQAFVAEGYVWDNILAVPKAHAEAYLVANLLRVKGDYKVYAVERGLKRHIPNPESFNSYNYKWEDIIEITEAQLAGYKDAVLVRALDDFKVYLLEGNTKQWIKTAQDFNNAGYGWNEVLDVSRTELESYTTKDEEAIAKKVPITVDVFILKDRGPFSSSTVTIAKGDMVRWINNDSRIRNVSSNVHPLHTLYPPLNLGDVGAGETVSFTFDTVGTYKYHDHLYTEHDGTVIVSEEK